MLYTLSEISDPCSSYDLGDLLHPNGHNSAFVYDLLDDYTDCGSIIKMILDSFRM